MQKLGGQVHKYMSKGLKKCALSPSFNASQLVKVLKPHFHKTKFSR